MMLEGLPPGVCGGYCGKPTRSWEKELVLSFLIRKMSTSAAARRTKHGLEADEAPIGFTQIMARSAGRVHVGKSAVLEGKMFAG